MRNVWKKFVLENILKKIDTEKVKSCTFVHDCDIGADNLVQQYWPKATIKYDPNHFSKKQCNQIDSFCSENADLKKIKDRIKSFYKILLHDRTQTLEEKVEKWRNSLDHYMSTENWNENENGPTIQLLKQLIQKFEKTFCEVDPNYSTNCCESFNKARSLLADKDKAWRISWRLRAYISIIRWNEIDWIQKILNEFSIYDAPHTTGQRMRIKREETKMERKTEEYKKKKNVKRKETKEKYKVKPSEKNVHKYKNEKKKESLSPFQKLVLEAILANSTEDKKFVSFERILKFVIRYSEPFKSGQAKKIVQSQLTRMFNNRIIICKKKSYALAISNEKAIEMF